MTSPLVNCPQCAATLNPKNMAKHLSKVHNIGRVKITRYGKVSGERVAQWLAMPADPVQIAIIRPRKAKNGVV